MRRPFRVSRGQLGGFLVVRVDTRNESPESGEVMGHFAAKRVDTHNESPEGGRGQAVRASRR
ncbi:MAG: hypothetical protein JWM25_264 [Thermoleophilia bacterium]|nr:hypothetical protein [Thermoleophilia bacterium]MCZ4495681.1 hypothetical protein [Thermoleophilia bacterium]